MELVKSIRPRKRLGQNFLINNSIAKIEAEYGIGKSVLELGPGLGMLTKALCKAARHVIAVEKDPALFSLLSAELKCSNLELLNKDFFELEDSYIEKAEMLIANIPYNLSSRVVSWLSAHRMPALLCMQKEFAEHMQAKEGTRKYSKLSVAAGLEFTVYKIMDVKAGNFYPRPKVDSAIVFIKPKADAMPAGISSIVAALMGHKKKKLRNAVIDARQSLGLTYYEALAVAGSFGHSNDRVFKLAPEEIRHAAEEISAAIKRMKSKNSHQNE
ncbi:MAG: 16S rRNA (adenine(1518)-N(6)/adenine(1519)-N(6))-dimethyltransferase RsmA [Candidatus Micrarchaeaceae archaeon]